MQATHVDAAIARLQRVGLAASAAICALCTPLFLRRLTRTFEGVTRAFGYAWLEDDSTDTTEYMDALIQT